VETIKNPKFLRMEVVGKWATNFRNPPALNQNGSGRGISGAIYLLEAGQAGSGKSGFQRGVLRELKPSRRFQFLIPAEELFSILKKKKNVTAE
jgi:hypothetical protein